MVHGGITFFRGTGASATAYLESDHHRADEYYLAEGSGLAERFVYGPEGSLEAVDSLDAEHYKAWVEWTDPLTGEVRGRPKGEARLRQSDGVVRDLPASPRFAEMTVNCDKSLSVAAALDPRISAALDDAQREAAQAMSEYVSANAVTRVGARGDQRLVKAERFEAAAVVHKTSRAGDPHRHVHLQWNTRVFAEGKWRGLWTTPTLKQQGALRGIGESVIRSHAGLRQAIADAHLTYDAATGKVNELTEHGELLSKRHAQVQGNLAVIEQQWTKDHPGATPTPAIRQRWEFQAWALDRPSKKTSIREVSETGWIEELSAAGLAIDGFTGGNGTPARALSDLDQQHIADQATAICEGKKSAWSVHDLQAAVADQVSVTGVVANREEINKFVAQTARKAQHEARSISDPRDGYMPDHVKHITSERVIAVEDEIRARFTARAVAVEAVEHTGASFHQAGLEGGQATAAEIISGHCAIGVVEGAAGSGKTTVLKAAKTALDEQGRELVVVAPTLIAAQKAAASLESNAYSIHKLLYEHGFRWDENGRFSRLSPGETDPNTGRLYKGPKQAYRLSHGARLVVDEAGMVDQETALALTQLADQHGAGLVLMGDRAQLPAVGRGGVLDVAAKVTFAHADMDVVHRFSDPEYAALSLRLRERDKPAELFDQLYNRGHIRIHESQEEAIKNMTAEGIATIHTGGTVALSTPTNLVAVELNRVMQAEMADAGRTREPKHLVMGSDEIVLRHGDTVMTRENDSMLGVANRETYTVKNTHENGDLTVSQGEGKEPIRLPADYVKENLHLGYASTEYGVQGATETTSAGLATESSNGAGTYVALTRGKEANTLHMVASSTETARTQFVDIMKRDDADRGIKQAKVQLQEQIEGLDLSTPPVPAVVPKQLGTLAETQSTPNTVEAITVENTERSATPRPVHQEQESQDAPEPSQNASAASTPVVDQELRERRLGAAQWHLEQRTRLWEEGRAKYTATHGRTPDEWVSARERAAQALDVAKEPVARLERSIPDQAERTFRIDHVREAGNVNASYANVEKAGVFAKRQARKDLESALDRGEKTLGQRPAGPIPLEPDLVAVRRVREQALKDGTPQLDHAKAAVDKAQKRLVELDQARPATTFTLDRKPEPAPAGTPLQEAAKDAAYAGRLAQTARARTQERNGPTPNAPQPSRGPER